MLVGVYKDLNLQSYVFLYSLIQYRTKCNRVHLIVITSLGQHPLTNNPFHHPVAKTVREQSTPEDKTAVE